MAENSLIFVMASEPPKRSGQQKAEQMGRKLKGTDL